MTARDDLRAEFSEIRQMLDRFDPTDHPAARLVDQQFEGFLEGLNDELAAIDAREIDLQLGGEIAEQHTLPAPFFVNVVNRLKGAYAYGTWAFRAGPGVSGELPSRIQRAAALDILAPSPGSFRFGLRRSAVADEYVAQERLNLEGDPREQALDAIVTVLTGAATETFDASVEDAVRELGPRAASSLRFFAKQVGEHGATIDVLVHYEAPKLLSLSAEQATALSSWLGEVAERLEAVSIEGVLRVIDTAHGRFGIEDAAGNLSEGRAAPDLLAGAVEGHRYRASVQVVRRVADHTGITRERMTLMALDPLRDH